MATGYMDKDFKLLTPEGNLKFSPGDDVTLPCRFSSETSAVAMEIRWFKGTDCIYLYKNGHVTEGRGYESRVSVNTQELQRGGVSLRLREGRVEDGEEYTCQVISGEHKEEGRVRLTHLEGLDLIGLDLIDQIKGVVYGVYVKDRRERMEESVRSLALIAWREAADELMVKKNQLKKRDRQLEERDRQLEERDRQLKEREREHLTDPDPPHVKKKNSNEWIPPNMGE